MFIVLVICALVWHFLGIGWVLGLFALWIVCVLADAVKDYFYYRKFKIDPEKYPPGNY